MTKASSTVAVLREEAPAIYVVAQISVEDYDLWKAAFDELRSELKAAGV